MLLQNFPFFLSEYSSLSQKLIISFYNYEMSIALSFMSDPLFFHMQLEPKGLFKAQREFTTVLVWVSDAMDKSKTHEIH